MDASYNVAINVQSSVSALS